MADQHFKHLPNDLDDNYFFNRDAREPPIRSSGPPARREKPLDLDNHLFDRESRRNENKPPGSTRRASIYQQEPLDLDQYMGDREARRGEIKGTSASRRRSSVHHDAPLDLDNYLGNVEERRKSIVPPPTTPSRRGSIQAPLDLDNYMGNRDARQKENEFLPGNRNVHPRIHNPFQSKL
ncbi:hypothetical protein JCM8547_007793 [Rhodosporidiobolus lusitaniae]